MNASASQGTLSASSDRAAWRRGARAPGGWLAGLAAVCLASGAAFATGFDPAPVSAGYEVGDGLLGPTDGDPGVDVVAVGSSLGADTAAIDGFDPPADFPGVVATDEAFCGRPRWTAQVDALMLWEGAIASRPLFVDSLSGLPALDASQLQPAVTIAPRYALMYHRDACRAIEVNYFELSGFDATQTLPVTEGGYTMNNIAGLEFNQVDTATATTAGHIKSFEGNLRRSADGGSIRWLTGFRWVEWGQHLGITDSGLGGLVTDAFDVRTLNNLYGWQWGADAMLWNHGGWVRVNGIGKAGVYYNHQAVQSTNYSDGVNPPVALAATRDAVAFVGEVGLNASLAITPWLAWRAGYSVFWLSELAVPANQLAVTDVVAGTASINTNGSVMLHGVTTGVEARW